MSEMYPHDPHSDNEARAMAGHIWCPVAEEWLPSQDEADAHWAKMREALAALSASQAREAGMREALERAKNCLELIERHVSSEGLLRAARQGIADARAALSPAQPAQGADIARELAEALDENWPFLAVWAQQYGRDACGGKMHRGHAEMLARVYHLMTKAHAGGLIPDNTTTRLPVLIAEAGYDLADLLSARSAGLLTTETEGSNG